MRRLLPGLVLLLGWYFSGVSFQAMAADAALIPVETINMADKLVIDGREELRMGKNLGQTILKDATVIQTILNGINGFDKEFRSDKLCPYRMTVSKDNNVLLQMQFICELDPKPVLFVRVSLGKDGNKVYVVHGPAAVVVAGLMKFN